MKREIIELSGLVQGVGFRYQVSRIARRFAVTGSVRNLRTHKTLEIDVEGTAAEIDHFIENVLAEPPAGGRVDAIIRRDAPSLGASAFIIGQTGE